MFAVTQRTYHENLSCRSTKISYFLILIKLVLWMRNILLNCFLHWSLSNIVSSFKKPEKSDKHGSLPYLLFILCTFLFHLSLKSPDSFDTRTHNVSGVSRKSLFVLLKKVSHFRAELNSLKPIVLPGLTGASDLISLL